MNDSSRWRICCLHRIGENIANYELISLESPTEVTFGRACTNNIVLDEAPSISRFHGVLRKENGNWTVTDLKSCNGVVVNGRSITPSVAHILQDKDIIEFGKDASSNLPAVYRFQFFKAAKVKVKQDSDGHGSKPVPNTSEKCTYPPVKKARENEHATGSPSLVRQKLAEQERLLREEMQRKEQEMQKRFEELQSILQDKEAEKENVMQQMLDYKEKMEVELSHQREHENKLASEKEEVLKVISETEKKAQEKILELETKLTTSLHKGQEAAEQLRREKEQIQIAVQKERETMEEEIQKKDNALEQIVKEKEGALKGLKQQLDDKQQKEADMSVIVENMRREKENLQRLMQEQTDKLEKEKEKLTLEMKEKMDQELREQETILRDGLEEQIAKLIMEKDSVETHLKSEMEKAIADKDKQLEGELRKKQRELADAIAKKEEEQEVLKAEINKHKEIGAKESQQVKEKFEDLMEEELVCSICNELFIKARSLGCSHTFCEYCIKVWMLRKAECPNCRSPIQSCVHSIVMDNYIEKTIEYLGKEQQDYRKQALADRKAEQKEFDKSEAAKAKKKTEQAAATLQAARTAAAGTAANNRPRNVFAINTQVNRNANSANHGHHHYQAYSNATAGANRNYAGAVAHQPERHQQQQVYRVPQQNVWHR